MTEPATDDIHVPEGAPAGATEAPTAAEVWERTVNPAPITKEEVRGEPAKAKKEKPLALVPDPAERTLVAPKIVEALAKKTVPDPSPIEERLARIEELLVPKGEPTPPSIEAEVAELKTMFMETKQEQLDAAAQAAEDAEYSLLREGVVSNIRADKERFPLLVGLHQEENVYHTLVAQLKDGKTVSEDDIASQAEAKLQAAFDAMREAKGDTTTKSKDPAPSKTTEPSPTLSTALSTGDGPTDVESILEKTGDRRQAAAELWDNIMNG